MGRKWRQPFAPLGRQDPATRIQHAQKLALLSLPQAFQFLNLSCVLYHLYCLSWQGSLVSVSVVWSVFSFSLLFAVCSYVYVSSPACWRVQLGYCSLFQSASRSLSFRLCLSERRREKRERQTRADREVSINATTARHVVPSLAPRGPPTISWSDFGQPLKSR